MNSIKAFFQPVLMSIFGFLILNLIWTDKLKFFVYPGYDWLIFSSGFFLFFAGIFQLYIQTLRPSQNSDFQYLNLILIFPILFALFVDPKTLSVDAALSRGLSFQLDQEIEPQTAADIYATNPENRTLVDWLKVLTFNPEPTVHLDKPVNFEGFIIDTQNPELVYIAQFVVSCCTADARPVSLPLIRNDKLSDLKDGQWINLKGQFQVYNDPSEGRKAVILPTLIEPIQSPKNPYAFR